MDVEKRHKETRVSSLRRGMIVLMCLEPTSFSGMIYLTTKGQFIGEEKTRVVF